MSLTQKRTIYAEHYSSSNENTSRDFKEEIKSVWIYKSLKNQTVSSGGNTSVENIETNDQFSQLNLSIFCKFKTII